MAQHEPQTTDQENGRTRSRRGRVWAAGIAISLGAALILVGGGYLVYADWARSNLSDLDSRVPEDQIAQWKSGDPGSSPLGAPIVPDVPLTGSGGTLSDGEPAGHYATATPDVGGPGQDASPPLEIGPYAPGSEGRAVLANAELGQLYPARWVDPSAWARPEWADATRPSGSSSSLPEGFRPITEDDVEEGLGQGAPATRIRIPAIGVDSTVNELKLRDLGDSQAFETPDNTVGHIPSTANPGEDSTGWYFGHLEDPLGGEGNVFRKLPEIPRLVREIGEPVNVILENENGAFLYRVFETSYMHEDELSLEFSDESTVTLVTCFPAGVYDHRLLVHAQLLAHQPADA